MDISLKVIFEIGLVLCQISLRFPLFLCSSLCFKSSTHRGLSYHLSKMPLLYPFISFPFVIFNCPINIYLNIHQMSIHLLLSPKYKLYEAKNYPLPKIVLSYSKDLMWISFGGSIFPIWWK